VRQLVSLVVLLLFTVPFGLSVTGCSKSTPVVYCNGADSGPVVGQVASISLAPTLVATGESLSYGQSGAALNATAEDCKGNAVSVKSYIFATSDSSLTYADINPSTGSVCAGSWNRNTGAGIKDYTTCTAPATTPTTHLAYVTATADGATSNSIPVWTHATVASVQITGTSAGAQGSTACTSDPTSDCCTTALAASAPTTIYNGTSCLSQSVKTRLIAKVFDSSGNNITCQVGNLTFLPQGTATNNIVTIDATGVATANQPGSTVITATIANSGSANTAGFFATCPPASITLTPQGQTVTNGSISVPVNQSQSFTTTILDTNKNLITGLTLQYASTSPQTVTAGATITPSFPGTATITAICQPPGCNPGPFSQIGLYGNGKPVTSNGITVDTTGTSSTVLYVASTQSQYLFPQDFTTGQQPGIIKLPYIPNSMVISQDGSTIYMGSPLALMTFSTASNTVTSANTNIVGNVLAVSPDGSTVAVVDPTRQTISLVSSSGTVSSTYNAVVPTVAADAPFPIRAEWSPDSQTLYITGTLDATNHYQLLVHSIFNGWLPISSDQGYSDVAVMVPAVGAYFGGTSTEGRTYCATSTVGSTGTPPTVTNSNYPLSDTSVAAPTDRVAATSDGNHILGATIATTPAELTDIHVSPTNPVNNTQLGGPLSCAWATAGITFTSTYNTYPLTGVTASAITGVVPANTSALSFVTYTGSSTNTAGQLPMYIPSAGTGTLSFVPLSGSATAPIAGVFNTSDLNFYAGTSGDNLVHIINVTTPTSGAPTAVDSGSPLSPNLPCESSGTYGIPVPACSGATTALPNLIVQRPKKSTS
jgi:trimeric autotransporter adhesin